MCAIIIVEVKMIKFLSYAPSVILTIALIVLVINQKRHFSFRSVKKSTKNFIAASLALAAILSVVRYFYDVST